MRNKHGLIAREGERERGRERGEEEKEGTRR
jgi:hypothetical protein